MKINIEVQTTQEINKKIYTLFSDTTNMKIRTKKGWIYVKGNCETSHVKQLLTIIEDVKFRIKVTNKFGWFN